MTLAQRFIFLVLCAFSAFHAHSQTYADSALAHVATLETPEERFAFLDPICKSYKSGPFNVENLYLKYMESAQNFMDSAELAQIALVTSVYYEHGLMLDKADSLFSSWENYFEHSKDALLSGKYYYRYSLTKALMNQNDEALKLVQIALENFDKLEQKPKITYGDALMSLGRYNITLNNFSAASEALQNAKNQFKLEADTFGVVVVLRELSTLFAHLGMYDEAKKYLVDSKDFIGKQNLMDSATYVANMARLHIIDKDYSSAVEICDGIIPSLQADPTMKYPYVFVLNAHLESLYHLGAYDSIQVTFEKMRALRPQFSGQDRTTQLFEQSEFLFWMTQNEFEKAETIGKTLYQNSRSRNDGAEIELHAAFLADLYTKSGKFDKALKYSNISTAKRDSLHETNRTNTLILYQTQYETQEKEIEIDRLAQEKELEKARSEKYATAAFSFGGIILVGGILFFLLFRARKKLKVQNIELEELNQTKDKFFGIIAHDLRSPIVALAGADEQMNYHAQKNNIEKLKKTSSLVGKTARNLNALLDNLLNWALLQRGQIPYHPEILSVGVLLEETKRLFESNALAKEIQLNIDTEPSDLSCFADKNSAHTILRNLTANAIKFTPKGGKIDISAKKDGKNTIFAVKDNGTGMSADQVAKLFTLDKKSQKGTAGEKGTGLGMTLCHDLLVLNKGSISVKSEEEKGSLFEVILPGAGKN